MKDHKELFEQLEAPEPPAHLARSIVLALSKRKRRTLYMKVAASATGFLASFYVTIAGTMSFGAELSRSGFFGFSSLLFSDFSSTIANFPDFIISIAESFPALSAAAVVAGAAFAVWSMATLIDETAILRHV
jgi:hypothetical protein